MARWPSGLRRQFKALVFGRGFESRSRHFVFFKFYLTMLRVVGTVRDSHGASYFVEVD